MVRLSQAFSHLSCRVSYKALNETFAEVVLRVFQAQDLVWIHDYQLMVLPAILREARPKMKIGWFLHTPFPSSEIYVRDC